METGRFGRIVETTRFIVGEVREAFLVQPPADPSILRPAENKPWNRHDQRVPLSPKPAAFMDAATATSPDDLLTFLSLPLTDHIPPSSPPQGEVFVFGNHPQRPPTIPPGNQPK